MKNEESRPLTCLCCGKPLPQAASDYEGKVRWHAACIHRFFGIKTLPELSLTEEVLKQLVEENTQRGFTVPGVQKKLSLHLETTGQNSRLTLVNYPTGYILKPQSETYPALPEAEFLTMLMAQKTGIPTVPFALLNSDSPAYITRRVDRLLPRKKSEAVRLLAMEDFCQLDERLTEDKYHGSYEGCARVIKRYSSRAGLDLSELFLRLVFCFVTGNSDMHLKNFSLLETAPESAEYALAPAYDLLPVNVVNPADTEQTALTLNGKKRNLHRNDFLHFAETAGIPKEAAVKMIQKVVSLRETYLELIAESYLPTDLKDAFSALVEERTTALYPAAKA